MEVPIPTWWWKGVIAGIALLAVGGAMTAVHQGYQDVYWQDCQPRFSHGPNGTVEEIEGPRPAEDCRTDRLRLTWLDASARATFGPGIAVLSLAGVYLIAAAIGLRRG